MGKQYVWCLASSCTREPGTRDVSLEFLDTHFVAGEPAYYYVRLLQADGQLAWSSPIWVEPPP